MKIKNKKQPTKSIGSSNDADQNTIICPHCKKETTVSALYSEDVVNHYKDPVLFEKGKWSIEYEYAESIGGDSELNPPYEFTCDKCEASIAEDQLNKLWKACHAKAKAREVNKTRRKN